MMYFNRGFFQPFLHEIAFLNYYFLLLFYHYLFVVTTAAPIPNLYIARLFLFSY